MVYDAEYVWTATVFSSMFNRTLPPATWKVFWPLRLEDCSDEQTIDVFLAMDEFCHGPRLHRACFDRGLHL